MLLPIEANSHVVNNAPTVSVVFKVGTGKCCQSKAGIPSRFVVVFLEFRPTRLNKGVTEKTNCYVTTCYVQRYSTFQDRKHYFLTSCYLPLGSLTPLLNILSEFLTLLPLNHRSGYHNMTAAMACQHDRVISIKDLTCSAEIRQRSAQGDTDTGLKFSLLLRSHLAFALQLSFQSFSLLISFLVMGFLRR